MPANACRDSFVMVGPAMTCLAFVLLLGLYIPFFFFSVSATTEIYTLSLHDALPICAWCPESSTGGTAFPSYASGRVYCGASDRSEEHTSELQSRGQLVCRLLHE